MDATAGTRLASEGTTRVEVDWHASLGGRLEGDRRLWPRGGGGEARTDAKAEKHAERGAGCQTGRRRASGALERGRLISSRSTLR
jgi:hypothetical protein